MPVDDVQAGEIFTVRVYKTYFGYAWANTYEVQAVTEPVNSITSIENLASAFVNLERNVHLGFITIDRVVISTYVQDGQPYNPTSFTSLPVSQSGARTGASEVLPLEMCLFVRRNAPTGRDGRLLYRGCLMESDMNAGGFRANLVPSTISGFQTIFATWLVSTFPGSEWNLVLASGPPGNPIVRQVTGFQVAEKIVMKKLSNRYYDRP